MSVKSVFALASMDMLTSATNAEGVDAVAYINALPARQITEYGTTGLLRVDEGVERFIGLASMFGVAVNPGYQDAEPTDQGAAEIAEAIQTQAVIVGEPWLSWPAFRAQVLNETPEPAA